MSGSPMDATLAERLARYQREADEQGIPGPDVAEHAEGYEGDCLCRTCLSYGEEGDEA